MTLSILEAFALGCAGVAALWCVAWITGGVLAWWAGEDDHD